jgi:hypothetical protein
MSGGAPTYARWYALSRQQQDAIVNGQPGLIAQQNGTTVTVLAFGITGDQTTCIWAVRNPDKLRPWTTG